MNPYGGGGGYPGMMGGPQMQGGYGTMGGNMGGGSTGKHDAYYPMMQPKPTGRTGRGSVVPFRAGDWKCGNDGCHYHNFAKNVSDLRRPHAFSFAPADLSTGVLLALRRFS